MSYSENFRVGGIFFSIKTDLGICPLCTNDDLSSRIMTLINLSFPRKPFVRNRD